MPLTLAVLHSLTGCFTSGATPRASLGYLEFSREIVHWARWTRPSLPEVFHSLSLHWLHAYLWCHIFAKLGFSALAVIKSKRYGKINVGWEISVVVSKFQDLRSNNGCIHILLVNNCGYLDMTEKHFFSRLVYFSFERLLSRKDTNAKLFESRYSINYLNLGELWENYSNKGSRNQVGGFLHFPGRDRGLCKTPWGELCNSGEIIQRPHVLVTTRKGRIFIKTILRGHSQSA